MHSVDGSLLPTRPLSHVPEIRLRRLYSYWNAIRGARATPYRADMDPLDIPDLLPWLILVDIEWEGDRPRFRYRLVGTAVTTALKQEATGKYLDEIVGSAAIETMQSVYEWPLRVGRPVFSRTAVDLRGSDYPKLISRLLAPMSRDGKTIDMYMNVQHFEDGFADLDDRVASGAYTIVDQFAVSD